MHIIKTDVDQLSVTVELMPDELNFFIDNYDKLAGECLRENNIEDAMYWVGRAKKIKEQQDMV